MLIKLLPDQIAKRWDFIYETVTNAMPAFAYESPDFKKNLLQSFLIGKMECWAAHEINDNGEQIIHAIITTCIRTDDLNENKTLLFYSLYAFGENFSRDYWSKGLLTLLKYAKAHNCVAVEAYTQNENLVNLARRLGGEIHSYISFPIRRK